MNTIRKIFLFLIVLGFGGLILLNAGIWTARTTILDRDVTKSWLNQSKVYDNFVNELANLVKKDQENRGGEVADGNVDIEALTRAAKEAFPPETLQKNVEAILDGTYDWLEQKTSVLVVDLDLTQEKEVFIDSLGNEGLSRITNLPTCQNNEAIENFDPFSGSCLPSGVNASTLMEDFKSEIANSDSVLPDTTLSSSDITIDYKGEKKPIDVALSDAPVWYGLLTLSPLVLLALIVVDSALIVLLSKPKRNGLKILGWFFGIVGGLIVIFGGANIMLRGTLVKNALENASEKGIAENILLPLIREVSFSIGKWNLIIGGAYIVVAVIFSVFYITKNRKDSDVIDTEKKEPDHQTPLEEKQAANPKPIPKVQ